LGWWWKASQNLTIQPLVEKKRHVVKDNVVQFPVVQVECPVVWMVGVEIQILLQD